MPIDQVVAQADSYESDLLFSDFCLKWPDFIEFDELNGKIITKHSAEEAYRIWSLSNYQLQFVLCDSKVAEFKICHGVMLLLYQI